MKIPLNNSDCKVIICHLADSAQGCNYKDSCYFLMGQWDEQAKQQSKVHNVVTEKKKSLSNKWTNTLPNSTLKHTRHKSNRMKVKAD